MKFPSNGKADQEEMENNWDKFQVEKCFQASNEIELVNIIMFERFFFVSDNEEDKLH